MRGFDASESTTPGAGAEAEMRNWLLPSGVDDTFHPSDAVPVSVTPVIEDAGSPASSRVNSYSEIPLRSRAIESFRTKLTGRATSVVSGDPFVWKWVAPFMAISCTQMPIFTLDSCLLLVAASKDE